MLGVILLGSEDKEIETVIVECDTLSNDSSTGWLGALHNEHRLICSGVVVLNIRNLCTIVSVLIQVCLNRLLRPAVEEDCCQIVFAICVSSLIGSILLLTAIVILNMAYL